MPKRLLLIESDKNVQACSHMLLQHYGFEVDTADSLETAKDLLSGTRYDIVIAELCFKYQDEKEGLLLLGHLKETCPETKVVVVTYLCDPAIKRKVLEYEIHGYFEKPVSFDKILKLIDSL